MSTLQHLVARDNATVRRELAKACRALAWYGMQDSVTNHVSAIAKSKDGNGIVVLTAPFGLMWQEITEECFFEMDKDTGVMIGEGHVAKVTKLMHLAAHRRRPDVEAVFHAHPQYATALCCTKDFTLRCIHPNSMAIIDRVAYDRQFDGEKDFNVEFDRLASLLGDTNTVLMMENHGIMTVGDTVAKAFDYMYKVEIASKIQLNAMSSGRELKEVSLARAEKFRPAFAANFPDICQAHLDAVNRIVQSTCK